MCAFVFVVSCVSPHVRVQALISVLSDALSGVVLSRHAYQTSVCCDLCVLICVLPYMCPHMCVLMCVLSCALICVLSYVCQYLVAVVL